MILIADLNQINPAAKLTTIINIASQLLTLSLQFTQRKHT
jgi:hypothetical protein